MIEKVALLELSNSALRMSLYKIVEGEYFIPLKQLSESIGMDRHIEGQQLIKSPKFRECQSIIGRFKKIAEAEGVSRYLPFASQTITSAKNYQSFVDELGRTVGLSFKILTDEEEVGALYSATTNMLDVPKGIIVNIASNSTRILHYNRRIVLDQVTIPFGSCSIESGFDVKKELEEKAPFLKTLDPEAVMVGIGETMTSFGKLARKITKYPVDIEHNYQADLKTFSQVHDFLKGLDPEKRQKLKGISDQSANSIFAGLGIAKAILEVSNIKQISISKGYRNTGLMFQTVMPSTVDRPLPDLLVHSLDTTMNHAGLSKKEAHRHYDLALILFKQLKALHRLPRTYARMLKTSAYLNGLSATTGVTNHEKGNYALLTNLPIYGLTHREQIMSAFVSSCKKWEDFNTAEWVKYNSIMNEGDLEAVKKLANILTLAGVMNIRKQDIVKDITCDILGDSVIIKLVADPDGKAKLDHDVCALEVFYAGKLASEFTKAFGKNLDVL
ncbi:MAG: hypothetical protein FWE31_05085 [Firmicutes bacterium]|nr:hypothetical protein [Bacillota bacterium]